MEDRDLAQLEPEARPGTLERLRRDPASRGEFLRKLGMGTVGGGALAVFLAACGSDDDERAGGADATTETGTGGAEGSDLEIVNYALTLEFLEADFYSKVVDSGLFSGAQLDLVKTFGDHEQQHVDALMQTAQKLGEPAQAPETEFPLDSADAVLELAATVENLGAAAYLGQAANIQSDEILAAALSIHTIEARHAAALNSLLGKSATPEGAFAAPASMDEVLEQVKPFIVS